MKRKLYFIIAFTFFLFTSSNVLASFTVAPLRFEFQIEKGKLGSGLLIVRNNGEKAVSVKIFVKDFQRRPDGSEAELNAGTISRSCSGWMTISPKLLTIEPGGRQDVRMNISVPQNAQGTYWTMIYVEQTSKPILRKAAGQGYSFQVNVIPRWGIHVIETIPGTEVKNGAITNVVVSCLQNKRLLNAEVEFTNTGNTILKCDGRIEIRDEFGKTVNTVQFKRFSVYPNGKRIVKTEIPLALKPGEYSALAVIDYAGESLVAGEAFFEIPE